MSHGFIYPPNFRHIQYHRPRMAEKKIKFRCRAALLLTFASNNTVTDKFTILVGTTVILIHKLVHIVHELAFLFPPVAQQCVRVPIAHSRAPIHNSLLSVVRICARGRRFYMHSELYLYFLHHFLVCHKIIVPPQRRSEPHPHSSARADKSMSLSVCTDSHNYTALHT